MIEITKQIREIATKLFQDGQVDLFIAWEKGDVEYQSKPFFARSVEDVEKIIFDEYSIHNIANSLLKFRDGAEKIGIVVKGCDSRGIVRLLEDNQFARERLYIIGVGCPGIKDPLKAMRNNSGFGKRTEANELADKCLECIEPNAVIFDEFVGEKQVARGTADRFKVVKEMENKAADERYGFFEEVLSSCIRCYACRQACVACNCRVCIFDETKPQWVGRETSISDNMMYHMIKALHMAGRCIECGECERVCPVNIPLMTINKKLIMDMNGFYEADDAGMTYTPGNKPPLSVFKENDPDNFI